MVTGGVKEVYAPPLVSVYMNGALPTGVLMASEPLLLPLQPVTSVVVRVADTLAG